jgi:low temperature requirement protein LtrA
MMTNAIKNLSSDSKIRDSLPVLLVTFSAILLAYSLTMDFFSLFYPYMVMFMMIFFGISEIFIREDSLLEAGNN